MPDASPPIVDPSRAWIARRAWSDVVEGVPSRVDIDLDAGGRMRVVFDGRGSIAGMQALCALVDAIRDEVGHDRRIEAIVDMRRAGPAPLRAQAIIGRWLLGRKDQITRIAVFGGGRVEMALARAVMTIAGMGQRAFFGARLEEALAFLGFPPDFHA
jgi:hypothetical protein